VAYISAGELRNRLPVGAPGLSDAELVGFIGAHMDLAAAENPEETPFSRAAVAAGAHADALEVLLARDGYTEMPAVEALRRQAAAYREQHDARGLSPGEPTVPDASAVVNILDEPLWSAEDLTRR
jgi:hypothetical protein